ncbi:hypothetical protein HN011_004489 [Eciton burchellii]|nr:hypothetical protein HN011_004489 [Eciton burchellii]
MQTNECHNELPVVYLIQTYFLTPISRIVIKSGTPRDCDELLPILFKIHDSWYRSRPRMLETIPQPNIQPLTHPDMEIRESIPCHKRNLFDARSRTPPVPHHVPRGKTFHVKHHSKRGNRTTHTSVEHLHDNPSGGKIFQKFQRVQEHVFGRYSSHADQPARI